MLQHNILCFRLPLEENFPCVARNIFSAHSPCYLFVIAATCTGNPNPSITLCALQNILEIETEGLRPTNHGSIIIYGGSSGNHFCTPHSHNGGLLDLHFGRVGVITTSENRWLPLGATLPLKLPPLEDLIHFYMRRRVWDNAAIGVFTATIVIVVNIFVIVWVRSGLRYLPPAPPIRKMRSRTGTATLSKIILII